MPQKMWRPRCQCSPRIAGMGSPNCRECGQPGAFDGWHLGMIEAMGAYQKQTGLKPIGPHRPLADELFHNRSEPCRTCHGRGVLDVDEGRTWKECPDCQGIGCLFKGTQQQFLEIRSRILSQFPNAASASFNPASHEAGEENAMTNKNVKQGAEPEHGDGEKITDVVHNYIEPEAEIRCVFYTLAVRNEALKKKWRDGLYDYWRRYRTEHNDSITATCFMGPYWDEQFKKLIENGLEEGKDFILFDASDVILMKDFQPFHFRVDWLDGYVHKTGVMVYMKH